MCSEPRQADEAVRICNSSKNNKIGSLNSKSHPRISRKTALTDLAIFRNTLAPVTWPMSLFGTENLNLCQQGIRMLRNNQQWPVKLVCWKLLLTLTCCAIKKQSLLTSNQKKDYHNVYKLHDKVILSWSLLLTASPINHPLNSNHIWCKKSLYSNRFEWLH